MYKEYGKIEGLEVAYQPAAYRKATGYANRYNNLEFHLIPICGLVLRRDKSPLRTLTTEDVEAIVVHDYLHPPEQCNLHGHTSIEQNQREAVSDWATELLNETRREYPRLGVFAKFHAHPFTGGRFLSGGDISANLMGENYARWVTEVGLSFVPMQVIWLVNAAHWNITTFVYKEEQLQVLPSPLILTKESRHHKVYTPPFWQTNTEWSNSQKAALREHWPNTARKEVGRGWLRFWIPSEPRNLLLLLPPDFPEGEIEVFVTEDGVGDRPVLIDNIHVERALEDISLLHVAERVLKEL